MNHSPNSPDRNELRELRRLVANRMSLLQAEDHHINGISQGDEVRLGHYIDEVMDAIAALQQTIEAEAITCDAQSVFPSEVVPLSTITKAFNEARGKEK